MTNKKVVFILMWLTVVYSCSENRSNKPSPTKEHILQADRDFSDLSAKKGMKTAFLSYAHDSVVMLRDNGMPIVGKIALEKHYQHFSDSTFTLIWEPLLADISQSGELGYSYGIFTLTPKDTSQKPERGTYCTIWKKDISGNWKFVLDTGNDGLGE